MVSDSIPCNNSPKDFNKKKRANRSAKLKQCKLDARREQWLSQVKNKGAKEDVENNGCEAVANVKDKDLSLGTKLEVKPRGEVNNDREGLRRHGIDSDSSPLNSPGSIGSCLSGSIGSGTNFTGSSIGSSSSSGGTCSGDVTEEEEEEEEEGGGADESDGCVDDWEAIADALEENDKKDGQNSDPPNEKEFPPRTDTSCGGSDKGGLREEGAQSQFMRAAKFNRGTRAWRPDDTFRPRGLPNVSKPHVLPMKFNRHSGRGAAGGFWAYHNVLSVPSSCDCPICYEELDTTDASFFPCPCGFRMCLFCYKRICEDDGRCPGCRKPYKNKEPIEGEASFDGSSGSTFGLAYKFSVVEDLRK